MALAVTSDVSVPQVTETACDPAAFAGYVHVKDVGEATAGSLQEAPPTVTMQPGAKPVPVTVTGTVVPPVVSSTFPAVVMETPETVGLTKVSTVTLIPDAVREPHLTVTAALPICRIGEVQLRTVLEPAVTAVHEEPPTVTVQPAARLVPVIDSSVPAAVVIEEGDTPEIVGAP